MNEKKPPSVFDLVREETDLYRRLLANEKERIQDMLSADPGAVEAGVALVREIVSGIKRCESELRIKLAGTPLLDFLQSLAEPHRAELSSLVTEFRRLLEELKRVQIRNDRHVRSGLAYSTGLMQAVFGASYDERGQVSGPVSIKRQRFAY